MKKYLTTVILLASALTMGAQDSYFVKTKGAMQTSPTTAKSNEDGEAETEEEEETDFILKNFRYHSLCDWEPGMKFMVMPDKYDMIVGTFCDAQTGKELGNGKLKHKIMIYEGRKQNEHGDDLLMFSCQEDGKEYYYPIPNGGFEEYCMNKTGVPTLAFLGDVDKAREVLDSVKLYTLLDKYYVDSSVQGDGIEEVKVAPQTEVTIVAIGVGTRSFPVKIIVEDKKGKQFFQYVAISRTNSGLRDDELATIDNVVHTFYGAFALADMETLMAGEYGKYIGDTIYTKNKMKMANSSGQQVDIIRMSTFRIKRIQPKANSKRVLLTLQSTRTQETFTKDVTFSYESVAGNINGFDEGFFDDLFGKGDILSANGVKSDHRSLIQQGKIQKGFTVKEVRLAKGKPSKEGSVNGRKAYFYPNDTAVLFDRSGKVVSIRQ